jgi:hypothetical protein
VLEPESNRAGLALKNFLHYTRAEHKRKAVQALHKPQEHTALMTQDHSITKQQNKR